MTAPSPTSPSSHESASLWVRLGAFVYDLFLLFAMGFAYTAIAFVIASALGTDLGQENVSITEDGDIMTMQADENFGPALSGPIFQGGLVATYLLFYMGFWHFKSATLGMQTWRLRLVTENGEKPHWRQLLLRCFLGFFALAFVGIGYLWILVDKNKLALHDRFSKTRIVRMAKVKKVKKIEGLPL